jgi:sulfate permease, SulP family
LWGLQDSPEIRLTWMLAICVTAALMQIAFHSMQLQRLTRYIPAPVFAGFLNAVALTLVVSQVRQIYLLVQQEANLWLPALVIAFICLTVAISVKRFKPSLPAGVLGLVAASATAFALAVMGHGVPSILPKETNWALPLTMLDSSVLDVAPKFIFAIFLELLISGFLLAVVIFLNTVVAAEVITQVDDKPEPTKRDTLRLAMGQILSACLGSVPISGAPAASLAAMRTGGPLEPQAIRLFCALAIGFYLLGLMAWLPQAAMIGLLLFEASCLFDRSSVAGIGRFWLSKKARRSMSVLQREDLLTVGLVTLIGALLNMVAALLAGMVLGLVLFAKRNGKTAIRDIRTAQSLRSNVARSTRDMNWLAREGNNIKCVRLQGALYFGIARSLRVELSALLPDTKWLVLDWRAVTSQDSTLHTMLKSFEQKANAVGVKVFHSSRSIEQIDDTSNTFNSFQDLDRALEECENQLIRSLASKQAIGMSNNEIEIQREDIFFSGFDEAGRDILNGCFEIKNYAPGETILAIGEYTRDMHLITKGQVDVMIADRKIRVASVGTGAILGEAGFLVGVQRAADAVALDSVTTHKLSYERFQTLSLLHPELSQRVLQNLCFELVNRLRSLHMQIERERH